ncbi:transposase [bacterium]|nr:transposase [bacterium]
MDGENFWLWNFVNRQVALFRIEEKGAGKVVKDTLGEEYEGILTCDFCSAYNDNIKAKSKQRCLTHLPGDQAPQLSRR